MELFIVIVRYYLIELFSVVKWKLNIQFSEEKNQGEVTQLLLLQLFHSSFSKDPRTRYRFHHISRDTRYKTSENTQFRYLPNWFKNNSLKKTQNLLPIEILHISLWLQGRVFRNTKITSGSLTDPFMMLKGKVKPKLDSGIYSQEAIWSTTSMTLFTHSGQCCI